MKHYFNLTLQGIGLLYLCGVH